MTGAFQVSLYSLVALASLLLAIGEERILPTPLTIPLAVAAMIFNERRRTVRLTTNQANVLGIAAFAIAGLEFWFGTTSNVESGLIRESQVLTGAHLLTWLTWIALFQNKQGRQYWWLLGLSVMHVAVAAILTNRGAFGGLLFVYVFLALWTLAVYLLYLARFSFEQADGDAGDLAFDSSSALPVRTQRRRISGEATTYLWNLPGDFRGSIQLDPDERWINSRFVAGLFGSSLLSVLIGALFFISIPRLWVNNQQEEDSNYDAPIQTVTGFTDEVQLGQIGQILESNEPVFEVHITDAESGRERSVEDVTRLLGYEEPLFRGSVMGRYEKGRWHVLQESQHVTSLMPPQRKSGRIRQHYTLHDSSSKILFAIHPAYFADIHPELISPVMDLVTSIVMRGKDERKNDFLEYAFFTRLPETSYEHPRIARPSELRGFTLQLNTMPQFTALPDGLDRLREQARVIAAKGGANEQTAVRNHSDIAASIQEWLRDSGEFSYSLRADVLDPKIDPIEDFLFNRKVGHCEYFASAMALMLRAEGIPSRLVSGFKGGDSLPYSGRFVVQQRHAHAWVEAWVDNDWRTYDPTPFEAREESVRQVGDERNIAERMGEILNGLWQQRILRLNFDEQRQTLYGPLVSVLKDAVKAATAPFGGHGRQVREFLTNPRKWFSWETFIWTAFLLTGLSLLRRATRRLLPDGGIFRWCVRRFRDWLNRLSERRQSEAVDFYRRYVFLLQKYGMHRARSQTHLEFAASVEERLGDILQSGKLAELPSVFAALYYRVRFGRVTLSEAETDSLAQMLKELHVALRSRRLPVKKSV